MMDKDHKYYIYLNGVYMDDVCCKRMVPEARVLINFLVHRHGFDKRISVFYAGLGRSAHPTIVKL